MIKAKLDELIEDILTQNDEITHYFDKKTGKTILITSEDIAAVEDEEDINNFPDWQQETIKIATAILNDTTDRYIELPSQFDIHEYMIMKNFSLTIKDENIYTTIEDALRGSGAFRRFKNQIHKYNLTEQWYKFRDDAIKETLIEWCKDNSLNYE